MCKQRFQRLDENKLAKLSGKSLCHVPKMVRVRQDLLHIGFFLYGKLSLVAEVGRDSVTQPGKPGVWRVYQATALNCS